MATPPLHITVTALSMPGDFRDIGHEIKMVKAALLYADTVTLASPKATILSAVGGLLFQPPNVRREAVRDIIAEQPNGRAALQAIQWLRGRPKGSLQPSEVLFLRKTEEDLRRAEEQMVTMIESLVSDASVGDLAEALDAKVLTLHPVGLDQETFTTDAMAEAVQELLLTVIGPAADTYPMFDDSAGDLARALINEGRVPGVRLERATQAGLAGRYIEQLEAFPDAEMSVILNARSQLATPLIRFRSGLGEMAARLKTTSLDPEFDTAADEAYRREIAPALDELRELAEERRLLPALRREATGRSAEATSRAVIALGVATMTGLADIAQYVAAVTAAVDIAAGVVVSRRAVDEKMKHNKFLWLYEAEGALR